MKIDHLVEKYLEGKISEDIYRRKLLEYEEARAVVSTILSDVDNRIEDRIAELDNDLDFAQKAYSEFEKADENRRRAIILRFGSNFMLSDRKLEVVLRKPLEKIEVLAPIIQEAIEEFEPVKSIDDSASFETHFA